MADSDIFGLSQAQDDYVDASDNLVIQKAGETTLKKIQVDDLFGGWRDLLGTFVSAGRASGVNEPAWQLFAGSSSVKALQFDVGEEVFLTYHVNHDMKQGATMYPHMHFTTDGTQTRSVKWEIEYTIAARNDVTYATFPTSSTVTVEASPTGTAWQHIVVEDVTGVATPEIDSIIQCRVSRITNGGTNNTDDVFGLTMDWHYPTAMHATKNRAPDFYV